MLRPLPYVTQLGVLVLYEPMRAREQILQAISAVQGNLTHAAEKLGVNHKTLLRWAKELGLARDIELIRIAAGWEDPRSHIGEMKYVSNATVKMQENEPRAISKRAPKAIKAAKRLSDGPNGTKR